MSKVSLRLKYIADTQEYVVFWYEGNIRIEEKTYYTNSYIDALNTMHIMAKKHGITDIHNTTKERSK